ncbi:MAG: NAD(P)-binding domain-containing protein [Gammaproteobacteria bacterium]
MQNQNLKLIAIGGLGNMLGPSSKHLHQVFVRVLDRGATSPRKDQLRAQWRVHGAELVADLPQLVGDGQFDGVVICAGKNGDDYPILKQLIPLLKAQNPSQPYFILHLSTLSCEFVQSAHAFCAKSAVHYANYPLTGGAKGAEEATMLILASGDQALYQRVLPTLQTIGKPKYFGAEVDRAAAVKLIGHVLVFSGLYGQSLAINLQKKVFNLPQLGEAQLDFFDFLNTGSGGSKQWEFPMRYALAHQDWQHGFLLHHALIDVFYTADLLRSQNLPRTLLLPFFEVALLMIYAILQDPHKVLATQVIADVIARVSSEDVEAFMQKHLTLDIAQCFQNCIQLLPDHLRKALGLVLRFGD